MSNIIQEVTDALDGANASPVILQKVPSYVKRAILNLQRRDIFPPRTLELLAGEVKEEKRDKNGELMYEFIRLPKDFRRLAELYVQDDAEPYVSGSLHNYHQRHNGQLGYNKQYTIKDIQFNQESTPVKVLILRPFPKNDVYINLSYHVDGTEDSLRWYDSGEFLEAIITEVMRIAGIIDRHSSEDEALDTAYNWKTRKGHNNINKSFPRTRGSFFGKAFGPLKEPFRDERDKTNLH